MKEKRSTVFTLLLITIFLLSSTIASYFYFYPNLTTKDSLLIELHEAIPSIEEFVINPSYYHDIHDVDYHVDTSTIGDYSLSYKVRNKEFHAVVKVRDTIAPIVKVTPLTVWYDATVTAYDFIKSIEDVSPTFVEYVISPDLSKPGKQDIELLVTDDSHNKHKISTTLHVNFDYEPPTIEGVGEREVYLGDTISYRKGISVYDNHDSKVNLMIDNSNVNPKELGTYEVIYCAKDSSGNITTVTSTLSIVEKPLIYLTEEEGYTYIQRILDDIIHDDMTELQQLRACYRWTYNHIFYAHSSDHTNWIGEAVRGAKYGNGDCYTYFVVLKAMFDLLDIEYIEMNRKPGNARGSNHYWHLVKYKDNWYHLDSCWYPAGFEFDGFLRTDAEVIAFNSVISGYYEFDTSLYPATPTTPLNVYRKPPKPKEEESVTEATEIANSETTDQKQSEKSEKETTNN